MNTNKFFKHYCIQSKALTNQLVNSWRKKISSVNEKNLSS